MEIWTKLNSVRRKGKSLGFSSNQQQLHHWYWKHTNRPKPLPSTISYASFFLSILILRTENEHNLEYRVVVWIDYKIIMKHWLQWLDMGGKRKEKIHMVSSLRNRRTEWCGLKQGTRQGARLGQKWWIPLWMHWLGSGRKPSRAVRTQCRDVGLREKIRGEWMMTEGSAIGQVPWGTTQTGDGRQPRESPEDCHF